MREGSGTAPEVSPRVGSAAGRVSGPSAPRLRVPGSEHFENRRGSRLHPAVCPGLCLESGAPGSVPRRLFQPLAPTCPGAAASSLPLRRCRRRTDAAVTQRCAFRASSPGSLRREIFQVFLTAARFTSLFSTALLSVQFLWGCWSCRAGQGGLLGTAVTPRYLPPPPLEKTGVKTRSQITSVQYLEARLRRLTINLQTEVRLR